jgi:hypothetical protein
MTQGQGWFARVNVAQAVLERRRVVFICTLP